AKPLRLLQPTWQCEFNFSLYWISNDRVACCFLVMDDQVLEPGDSPPSNLFLCVVTCHVGVAIQGGRFPTGFGDVSFQPGSRLAVAFFSHQAIPFDSIEQIADRPSVCFTLTQ